MKVLENMYVAARARRVHFDLPHSQVMKCVTCILTEKPLHSPTGKEGEVWRFGEKKNSKTLEVG